VIANPGAALDAQELKEWANSRLAKTQRVAAVMLRDDFPRNAMGKVVKPDLRREYADLLMKQPA
jgi:acyl-CoA synthetase (AMP-forming)/AMP-acid ligase II